MSAQSHNHTALAPAEALDPVCGMTIDRTDAVTLVKGDLRGIVRARRLSRITLGNIKQNLFFAFVYNAAGVPIARRRRPVSVLRGAVEPNDRGSGHELQLGVRHWQRVAP